MSTPNPSTPPSSRLSGTLRGLVYFAIAVFVLGIGAFVWTLRKTAEDAAIMQAAKPHAASRATTQTTPATQQAPLTLDAAEARMAMLEARLADAEQRAATARDDASRAERLLILASARRAVDHGAQLGYLEAMLQREFAQTYPRDVGLIAGGARQPVTLDQLSLELSNLTGSLKTAPGEEGWVGNLMSDLRGLAVVRKSDAPSDAPAKRLERAQRAMARDQVDLAITEVAAMPGAAKARAWLDRARRYVAVHQALDRLEAVTILNPQPQKAPTP
jgi:hypothetical protein